jgi:hypothetical protein
LFGVLAQPASFTEASILTAIKAIVRIVVNSLKVLRCRKIVVERPAIGSHGAKLLGHLLPRLAIQLVIQAQDNLRAQGDSIFPWLKLHHLARLAQRTQYRAQDTVIASHAPKLKAKATVFNITFHAPR